MTEEGTGQLFSHFCSTCYRANNVMMITWAHETSFFIGVFGLGLGGTLLTVLPGSYVL